MPWFEKKPFDFILDLMTKQDLTNAHVGQVVKIDFIFPYQNNNITFFSLRGLELRASCLLGRQGTLPLEPLHQHNITFMRLVPYT
jgi:hypothetical protein